MKFTLENIKYNPLVLMRKIGYHPVKRGESFARRLGNGEFPRFHIYIKDKEGGININLHLDQKGACYTNQTAHSGEYDTEILEQEKDRIISLI